MSLSVCVFCGAKSGADPRYARLAGEAGAAIAARGWTLVYGGGRVGLMGALADGALSAGGAVVGVIPETLMRREVAHHGLAELDVVADMATRKTRMIARSDVFLALPGGLGTLDELFEVLTLRQIGVVRRPCAVLDDGGYWAPMMAALRGFVDAGFVAPADLDHVIVAPTITTVLERLGAAASPDTAG